MTVEPHPFAVVSGRVVHEVLTGQESEVVGIVEDAYRAHAAHLSVNPPSYFLRFPDRPESRIIALPASLGGDDGVDGLKWIGSFPRNVERGLQRASAVLILNRPDDGYPFACMEASIVSATRTAASAALAADHLTRGRGRPRSVGFYGGGVIARHIHRFLHATGWRFDQVGVFDAVPSYAEGFARSARRHGYGDVRVHPDGKALVGGHDLVVFATTAGEPHVVEAGWFSHAPVVLHVSLRDLSTGIVLDAVNVVDDVDHCLRAGTSLHLAEQETGHRRFVDATLGDVLDGSFVPPADRTVVFSPFGLGILDLAVGRYVYREAERQGRLHAVDGFFHELARDI